MSLEKSFTKDLSPRSIKTAVAKSAVQKPLVVYPVAVTALGVLFGSIFDFGLLATIPIVGGAIVSAGSYFWNVVANGSENANAYIQAYRLELEEQLRQTLEGLKKELDEIGHQEAHKQVSLFQKKYSVFKEVLNKKMEVGELTYNRYLSIAEQVFLGGLDNIENAALALRSVSTIDTNRIQTELSKLSNDDSLKKNELTSRLRLHDEQIQRAQQLLLENETALTQLDLVTSKIANINTKQQRAEIDLEDAMKELRRLIERTESYSN